MANRKRQEEQEEDLVSAIRSISRAAKALAKSGLKRKAVIILVAHETKLSQTNVRLILESLDHLAEVYTNREVS